MTMGCSRCGEEKDEYLFYPSKKVGKWCISCDKEHKRQKYRNKIARELVIPNTKLCSSCLTIKPSNDFKIRRTNSDSLSNQCISCEKINKEKYCRNPRRERDLALRRTFNMTHEDFDLMENSQNGVCKICGSSPSGKFKYLSVDHDHSTGRIRGLLCNKCNSGLGLFNDSSALLVKASKYLSGELE